MIWTQRKVFWAIVIFQCGVWICAVIGMSSLPSGKILFSGLSLKPLIFPRHCFHGAHGAETSVFPAVLLCLLYVDLPMLLLDLDSMHTCFQQYSVYQVSSWCWCHTGSFATTKSVFIPSTIASLTRVYGEASTTSLSLPFSSSGPRDSSHPYVSDSP